MKPVFMIKNIKDTGYSKNVGADESHLKLSIVSENGIKFNGIGFNLGKYYNTISKGNLFDIVCTIEENHWNGNTSLQLSVKDIRFETSS